MMPVSLVPVTRSRLELILENALLRVLPHQDADN